MTITRRQYMRKEYTFEEFYGQFVTPGVTRIVLSCIGRDRILASTDPHFNDIPLPNWDRLNLGPIIDHTKWREALEWEDPKTYPWALSDNICIAKLAAQLFKTAHPIEAAQHHTPEASNV